MRLGIRLSSRVAHRPWNGCPRAGQRRRALRRLSARFMAPPFFVVPVFTGLARRPVSAASIIGVSHLAAVEDHKRGERNHQ
jgi:hypothetical protein